MFRHKRTPHLKALEFVTWQKQQILAKVPSNLEGIDMPRVLSFMRHYNFNVAPYVVVDAANLDLLMRVFKEVRQTELIPINGNSLLGKVVSPMGLCLVLRVPELEQIFGPGLAEYNLVHELIHAAAWRETNLSLSGDSVELHRLGLAEGNYGSFFEEGFTHLYTQEYVEHWMGWPHGLGNKGQCASVDDLPYKYVVSGKNGEAHVVIPALAGHGLQLLIKRSRKIYPALKSVVDGGDYGIVRRSIASIGGNDLFERLYRLDYTRHDFLAGRQAIMDALR